MYVKQDVPIGGGRSPSHARKILPSYIEMSQRYQVDPDGFEASALRGKDCQQQKVSVSSAMGTAHYVLKRLDKEAAEMFFDHLVSGANISGVLLLLRNRLLGARYERLTSQEQLAITMRAWNAWRQRREISFLVKETNRGKLSNANFPWPV